MGIARRIVFPIIRLVLWAVIAVALAVLAFGDRSTVQAQDPLEPVAEVSEPQIQPTSGSVVNTVTVTASVVADPVVPVRATTAGKVSVLLAENGQPVAADTAVVEVVVETPVDPTVTTDPETGIETTTEHKPRLTYHSVVAGSAGTLKLDVLAGQEVAVGDQIGTITPGTLSVQGTLTADQQYRLINPPTEGEVTLKGGPAPFTCTGLTIGAAEAETTSPDQEQSGDLAGTTSGVLRCAIPAEVTAFPGLGADISIVNGQADDALLLPASAVHGSVQNGVVWVLAGDGSTEERPVVLGLTDGQHVQIVEGLTADEWVLEYVPVTGGDLVDCSDPNADPSMCV